MLFDTLVITDSQRLCIGLLELLKLGIIEDHREKFVFQCGDESDTTENQTAAKLTPPDLFDKAVLLVRRATCCCGERAYAEDGHECVSSLHTHTPSPRN